MGQSNSEKAIKGARSQTIIVLMKGALSLVYFSIMSRLLTPDDFGYFALITAVTTILASLSEAGFGSAVIQKKDANNSYSSTAFTLSLCLGVFFSVLLFFGAPMFSKLVCRTLELTLAFKIMSSIILLSGINNITWALYMRKLDFFKFGILQILSETLSYIVGVIFAFKGYGFYSIVAAAVANQLFLTLILISLKKYQFKFVIVKKYVKEIIGYGGWLTASVILRNLTDEIDKVIIGRMLPLTDLGAINRPSGFVNRISSQVNGIFDTVLFPILSSIQDDPEIVKRAYAKSMSLIVTLSIILSASMILCSDLILYVFFGSQWLFLKPILIIFSLGLILNGFSRLSDSFFRSLGIVKRYFFARLINWVIVITLVWLACHLNITIVAIAMVLGNLISCCIKYIMQRNYIRVGTLLLLRNIFENTWLIILLFLISYTVYLLVPYGKYLGIVLFISLLGVTMVFTPKMYGRVVREMLIDRYILKYINNLNQ